MNDLQSELKLDAINPDQVLDRLALKLSQHTFETTNFPVGSDLPIMSGVARAFEEVVR